MKDIIHELDLPMVDSIISMLNSSDMTDKEMALTILNNCNYKNKITRDHLIELVLNTDLGLTLELTNENYLVFTTTELR
jgi:hypothetical protein